MNKSDEIKKKFLEGTLISLSNEEDKNLLKDLLFTSNKKAKEQDFNSIKSDVENEKNWWVNSPAYENLNQIISDINNGNLVEINSDENLKLIMRLESDEFTEWQPYLPKETALLLKKVGQRWREKMRAENLPEEIKLAITNLLISREYQKDLISRGKLALEGSSHSKGQSFDIDGCGYYLNNKSVNPRQTGNYDKIYIKRVHKILKEVLEELKNENALNFIQEFPNSNNQSFHATRNPNYK